MFTKQIHQLLNVMDKLDLLKDIQRAPNFPDEPYTYGFTLRLQNIATFSDGDFKNLTASALSFFSAEIGLLKCLMEGLERFSLVTYKNTQIKRSSFTNLKKYALDPMQFVNKASTKDLEFGWLHGIDFIEDRSCLLPAQTLHINYLQNHKDEAFLTSPVSTGAAAGFTHESTLLRALYEVIERDAFMCVYLNKNKPPQIDISRINNNNVQTIIRKAKRYRLELFVFDITNNLNIPTFLAVLIDKTGIGPAVSVGLKTNLSTENALVDSMEEAFLSRSYIRVQMYKRRINTYKSSAIQTIEQRGLYWAHPKMVANLAFLLNQKTMLEIELTSLQRNEKEELHIVHSRLKEKNIEVYYADITAPQLKEKGVIVYKGVMPQLQPLYLHEDKREWKIDRLKTVYEYFEHKDFSLESINDTPHPLL